jgi:hypothetical protein
MIMTESKGEQYFVLTLLCLKFYFCIRSYSVSIKYIYLCVVYNILTVDTLLHDALGNNV